MSLSRAWHGSSVLDVVADDCVRFFVHTDYGPHLHAERYGGSPGDDEHDELVWF